VQFYWDIIAAGTPAEGATLHFKRIPTEIVCLDCNNQYFPQNGQMACPTCESINVKIISGEEFFLESIEIET
jgi:hydrogenase nickel incorporation protein HypA/HybF